MSESANGAARPADDGERTRRRQYRIISRVLKEYTARLYRIAHHLGEYLDGRIPSGPTGGVPSSVETGVFRVESLVREVQSAALFASQMLVHYGLDEAEAAELRIRTADAERAVGRAELLAAGIALTDRHDLRARILADRDERAAASRGQDAPLNN
jgi:hypothetical protein